MLAAGLTMGLKDDMWRLEAKGMESDVKEREAAGARQQNIMFVRGETQVIFRIDVTWLLCSAKDGWNNLRCTVSTYLPYSYIQ